MPSLFSRKSSLFTADIILLTEDGDELLTEDGFRIIVEGPTKHLFTTRGSLFAPPGTIVISNRYGVALYGSGQYAASSPNQYGAAAYNVGKYA